MKGIGLVLGVGFREVIGGKDSLGGVWKLRKGVWRVWGLVRS